MLIWLPTREKKLTRKGKVKPNVEPKKIVSMGGEAESLEEVKPNVIAKETNDDVVSDYDAGKLRSIEAPNVAVWTEYHKSLLILVDHLLWWMCLKEFLLKRYERLCLLLLLVLPR
ncbi:hypothetical protein COLO4_29064 [Corchorus olitorius]|uniref:Uncharacterized protein n=1 Tax=Corchorus olitorius TaxID=93759 RepID=A0A1R3HGD1_9ROSI|nr:hypothetical protein COLO4_29064 [Corchorus olitorius]